MTLVVAYCDGINISVISDTLLTENQNTLLEKTSRNEPWHGVLKILVIDNHRFIAFAGVAEYAIKIIRNIYHVNSNTRLSTQIILELLVFLRKVRTEDLRPDFIVGEVTNKTATIHKISRLGLEKNVPMCTIGSHNAYRHYLEYFHELRQNSTPRHEAPTRSMNRLIESIDDENVGGFSVELVSTDSREFAYVQYSKMFLIPRSNDEGWQPLYLNTPDRHGWAYAMLTPKETGVAAVGFYILQLNVTFIFSPLISLNSKIEGPQEFALVWAKENLGIEFECIQFG